MKLTAADMAALATAAAGLVAAVTALVRVLAHQRDPVVHTPLPGDAPRGPGPPAG